MKKKTLFVNFYGGPCSSKSTHSSAIFAELKFNKISTELISEYAKKLVWTKSFSQLKDQIYILGKQHNKQVMVDGQVDVAVTDSPFIISIIYDDGRTKYLKELGIHAYKNFWNLNIFLERGSDYDPVGRTQKTIDEAIAVDNVMKQFLIENNIEFVSIPATRESIPVILELIKTEISKNGSTN